ncbi:NAD(P)-binding domain-containing protein [Cellulomonas sp. McL0617]|uniref:NAD(P)-binding domain-containing protein n=1 Tax=Cellulomonas sp. McL0617 TaxID=3415675 RepID=UPI003CFA3A8C
MITIDTIVIGAGHAGLAASRLLTQAGRDHVVLDRGRIGERWRTERWDSLRLLTPNWMTRLPSWQYVGTDPESYQSSGDFLRYLEAYASSYGAPVVGGTAVLELTRGSGDGDRRYLVVTDRGTWSARHVIIATGPYGTPRVPPGLARQDVLMSNQYRNPAQLPTGGILVVGASSSGVQIADELNRAGRDVTLAVGGHTRMPRRYRGLDIFWWLERTGRLARTIDDMPDPEAARREPSFQLVGRRRDSDAHVDVDLSTLQSNGVRLAGRMEHLTGSTAHFRPDLPENVASADDRMHRFLDAADRFAERTGLAPELRSGSRPRPVELANPPRRLDLGAERIATVVLATGYRSHNPWLRLPITRPGGVIAQRNGVTSAPGVYTVGQRFQHRRDSGFIDGARHDARFVVEHLTGRSLGARPLDREPAA